MADYRDEFESPEQDGAAELLAQAAKAKAQGQGSLAFHLYFAACEQMGAQDARREKALRAAWDIAISLNDRRLAESALEKLMPHLRPEEAAQYAQKLAGIAMNDLSALGIDPSMLGGNMPDLSEIMENLPPGLADMVDMDQVAEMLGMNTGFNVKLDDEGPIDANALSVGASDANSGDKDEPKPTPSVTGPATPQGMQLPLGGMPQGDMAEMARQFLGNMFGGGGFANPFAGAFAQTGEQKAAPAPRFADVPGFSEVKRELRALGIGINPDSTLGRQAEEDLAYHGIDGSIGLPSVIIRVPEGTDCTRLVHAAAGEMGVPFGQISISVSEGHGRRRQPEVSMRVRGDFAPMRPGDAPVEGILLIDNADIWPEGLATHSRRIGDYISTLAGMPRCAVILTTTGNAMPPRDLLARLGDEVCFIEALPPKVAERYEVWSQIASSHPSAADIDVALLAMVSDGMLPDSFEQAVHDVATDAWRIGVHEGKRFKVTTLDVLGRLAEYAPDEKTRERILEVVDTQWSAQLDKLTAEDLAILGGADPSQDAETGASGE